MPSHPAVRSQLRVRNLSGGVVYNLVFDGSLERLSGMQLRTHLQGISEVPASHMEIFVETTNPSPSAPHQHDATEPQMHITSITNTTRGADVGLVDGSVVYMRVHPHAVVTEAEASHSVSYRDRRDLPSSVHHPSEAEDQRAVRRGGPTSQTVSAPAVDVAVDNVPRTLSRLAPPAAPKAVASTTTTTMTTPSKMNTTAGEASTHRHTSRSASRRDRQGHRQRRPSLSSQRGGQSVTGHLDQAQDMRDDEYEGSPMRASMASSRTRVVVAPPWAVLSTSPPSSSRKAAHAEPESLPARTQTGRMTATADRGLARSHARGPVPPTTTTTTTTATTTTTPTTPPPVSSLSSASALALCANDLEELFAEQEYVWRMERHRFETERDTRRRLIDERHRQSTYDAARLDREQRMWSAKIELEQARLQAIQSAFDREIEVMSERLTLRGRDLRESSPPRLLVKSSPETARRGGAGLFDGDESDEITVEVEV